MELGMFFPAVFAVIIALIVTNAQRVPKENTEYIGKTVKDINNEFGIPSKEYKVGKYKVLEYIFEHGSVWTRGAFSNTKDVQKFYILQGKVVKHETYCER